MVTARQHSVMRDSSTEALLFDLGGVVFGIDFDKAFSRWATQADVPMHTVKSRYLMDVGYERHERGEITAAEYFDTLRVSLGISLSDEQFASGWNAIFEPELAGVCELFESLHAKIPIYAFSNSNDLHRQCWARKYAGTLSLFRQVFISCDLGLRKPDAAAYRQVAAAIGAEPERVLFFDDTLENVEGARGVGMSAVQVRSIIDIRTKVAAFLD
ncbi:MAG: HAD family phosphatase [Lysobacterales bacterium]|nr:MAG: HAD family phosphatase [Xanthomonadales bacterium]